LLAKKRLLRGEVKMVEGNTLEDYITNFTILLLEAAIDIGSPTTDNYPYIIQFQAGLLPRFSKHGHNDVKTQVPFPTLHKYWDFLRIENSKDISRRENEEDLRLRRSHLNILKTPPKSAPERPHKTDSLKRKHVNLITSPPYKRPHMQGSHSQSLRSNKPQPGDWEDQRCWHSSMTPYILKKSDTLPPGYPFPRQALTVEDDKCTWKVVEVMTRVFRDTDKDTLIKVALNTGNLPSPPGKQSTGLAAYCVFHRTNRHGSLSCPCFRSHWHRAPGTGAGSPYTPTKLTWADCKCTP
jgi:hypothetical protein